MKSQRLVKQSLKIAPLIICTRTLISIHLHSTDVVLLRITLQKLMAVQMKSINHYFHVVLFIMLYKVILTFQSVDETLVCDHSNESY